jgi:hypothetical protein
MHMSLFTTAVAIIGGLCTLLVIGCGLWIVAMDWLDMRRYRREIEELRKGRRKERSWETLY